MNVELVRGWCLWCRCNLMTKQSIIRLQRIGIAVTTQKRVHWAYRTPTAYISPNSIRSYVYNLLKPGFRQVAETCRRPGHLGSDFLSETISDNLAVRSDGIWALTKFLNFDITLISDVVWGSSNFSCNAITSLQVVLTDQTALCDNSVDKGVHSVTSCFVAVTFTMEIITFFLVSPSASDNELQRSRL